MSGPRRLCLNAVTVASCRTVSTPLIVRTHRSAIVLSLLRGAPLHQSLTPNHHFRETFYHREGAPDHGWQTSPITRPLSEISRQYASPIWSHCTVCAIRCSSLFSCRLPVARSRWWRLTRLPSPARVPGYSLL